GKQQAQCSPVVLANTQLNRGRAENVSDIPITRPHPRQYVDPAFVVDGLDLAKTALRLRAGVDRPHRLAATPAVALIEALHLKLLNMAAVRQHEADEFRRPLRRIDRPLEAEAAKFRNEAAMIDMGVGKEHRVNLARFEGKRAAVQFAQRFVALK